MRTYLISHHLQHNIIKKKSEIWRNLCAQGSRLQRQHCAGQYTPGNASFVKGHRFIWPCVAISSSMEIRLLWGLFFVISSVFVFCCDWSLTQITLRCIRFSPMSWNPMLHLTHYTFSNPWNKSQGTEQNHLNYNIFKPFFCPMTHTHTKHKPTASSFIHYRTVEAPAQGGCSVCAPLWQSGSRNPTLSSHRQ